MDRDPSVLSYAKIKQEFNYETKVKNGVKWLTVACVNGIIIVRSWTLPSTIKANEPISASIFLVTHTLCTRRGLYE